MSYLFNALYLVAVVLLSPWLVYRACTAGKYRRGILAKLLGLTPIRKSQQPCAWFHGVSVGEVHLLRQVIAAFRQKYPQHEIVVSSTTDTGLAEAQKHFSDVTVFWWPLDFTWAVRRALRRIHPDLVVLAEGEIWPNFLRAAKRAGVKVAVINGRISPRSARRFMRFHALLRPVFGSVDLWLMQTEEYAAAVRVLGGQAVYVTGNVKYDGVQTERVNPKTQLFRELFAVAGSDLVWVAGSTQAPEEKTVLTIWQQLRAGRDALRLIVVPRQKDRFDEVADLLRRSGVPFVRRSELSAPVCDRGAVILLDSIGELGAVWGLADVAFVGGSLDGKRGGQNMIEPAAYGAAVVFGPHVWNFRDTVARLLERGAALQVADAAELRAAVERLLDNPGERVRLGVAAQAFVRSQQGATETTVRLLGGLLARPSHLRSSAA